MCERPPGDRRPLSRRVTTRRTNRRQPSEERLRRDERVHGVDVTRASRSEIRRIRRRIGMIFQQFNLVKRSSVFSNVLSGKLGTRPAWRTIAFRPTRDEVREAFENLGRVGIVDKAYARADA